MTPSSARSAPLVIGSAILATVWGVGCAQPGDPVLSNLRFNGAAEDSPLVLLLAVDFKDDDGDLSAGVLESFINQRATSAGPLPLLPIFLTSEVEEGATQGSLEFVLELAFADETPPSGTTFALGARVTDGAANSSATQEIRLKLETP